MSKGFETEIVLHLRSLLNVKKTINSKSVHCRQPAPGTKTRKEKKTDKAIKSHNFYKSLGLRKSPKESM